ncbi:AraC family transcriptional regulator [Pokkaliibacter plantistimulans]|uniref:AraC family transcriptional regulator n=1 Tax=Proteobacteria bacterium 228 TaxID=2083153 RepID=A0A2S5KW02_9PROT|nr:helix-turn-helix transcriptional regulator [Pokkaliibacter plantistimulans]PPC78875.1 AraC family transcriptional regulator [Pokkaliibacter plantistimulans]
MFASPSRSPDVTSAPPSGIEAMRIEHEAGKVVAEHDHAQGQLAFVLKGALTIISAEGWWVAPPGQAVWVPPHLLHEARYSKNSVLIKVLLDMQRFAGLPQTCRVLSVSPLMRELALAAVDCLTVQTQSAVPASGGLLPLIIPLLVETISTADDWAFLHVPQAQDSRLRLAIDYIWQHLHGRLEMAELAAVAHCSERTLARLFSSETGLSPGQLRERLRLIRALELLAQGYSVTQTALEVGYSSSTSFTSMFSRVMGLSPRTYLQRMAG